MEGELDKAVKCIDVVRDGWLERFEDIMKHLFPLRNGGRRMVVMLLVGKLRREMARNGIEDGGRMVTVLEKIQEKYGIVETDKPEEDEEEENMGIEEFLKKMVEIDLGLLPSIISILNEEEDKDKGGDGEEEDKEGGYDDGLEKKMGRQDWRVYEFFERLKVADDILSFLSTVIFLSIRILF
jgi:hypothetical protein